MQIHSQSHTVRTECLQMSAECPGAARTSRGLFIRTPEAGPAIPV